MSSDFVDHYEALEVSPKANIETIERVFRQHAKKMHPDVNQNHHPDRFKHLIEAFETLSDPESRAQYDIVWEAQRLENKQIVQGANEAESDCEERAKLLTVFYAKRRKDMKEPGVSVGRLEDITQCSREILQFHLWYFQNKGWIEREESGLMSITAAGVDKIEDTYLANKLALVSRFGAIKTSE